MTSDNLLKPFDLGFQRKLEMSPQSDNKFSVIIYYTSPEGHRLANKTEVNDYLKQKGVSGVNTEDFSFVGHPIHKEPYETQSWLTSSTSDTNNTHTWENTRNSWFSKKNSKYSRNSKSKNVSAYYNRPSNTLGNDNTDVVLELKADPDADVNNTVIAVIRDIKPSPREVSPYIVVKPEVEGEATADQVAMMKAYYSNQTTKREPKSEPDVVVVKEEVPSPVGFIQSPNKTATGTGNAATEMEPAGTPSKPGLKRPLVEKETTLEKNDGVRNKKQKKQLTETAKNHQESTASPRTSGRKAAIEGRAKIRDLSSSGVEVNTADDSDRDDNYTASIDQSDSDNASPVTSDDDSDFEPAASNRRRTRGKNYSPRVSLRQLSPKELKKWTGTNTNDDNTTILKSQKTSQGNNGLIDTSKSRGAEKKAGPKPVVVANVNSRGVKHSIDVNNKNDTKKVDCVQKKPPVKSAKTTTTASDDCGGKRIEILTLGKKEFKLQIPVSILPSVNTCSKPEMRSLYAGDPAGRDWVKVLGKVKDSFLYQCMFCAEARKEPKLISSHQVNSHKKLLDMMSSLKPGKSQMFLFCRHCDYISMQKSVMWHHMQSVHDVKEILLPEADPKTFVLDKRNLGYIDQKKVFYCPDNKCSYKTHYNPEIIEHMLNTHRSTDHVHQGFVHVKKAKLPPHADQQDDAFMCNMCQFVTFQSFLMEVHCMEAHAKKFMLYSCLFCEEQFIGNSISRVEKHLLEKHSDPKVKVSVTVITCKGEEDQDVVDSRDNGEGQKSSNKSKTPTSVKPSEKKSKKS